MASADVLAQNAAAYGLPYADDAQIPATMPTSADEASKQRMARMGSWVVRDDVSIDISLNIDEECT
jgi:hypothetical protein